MATTSEIVVSSKKLTKTYGHKVVVNAVDLEVYKGECFGFLGPNGAGKSTLLKMIYAQTQITHGDLFVLGLNAAKNSREIKSRIGVVPQDNQLDVDFNIYDNLFLFAKYHNLSTEKSELKIKEMIRKFRLEDHQYEMPEELSGGLQRRAALARALLNDPELVLFDEPTTGLDPNIRRWLWQEILDLKKAGITILLSTHIMEEAQQLCDRLALLAYGKIVAVGAPQDLIAENFDGEVVEMEFSTEGMNYYTNRLKEKLYQYQVLHNRVYVFLKANQSAKQLLDIVVSPQIEIRKPNLEDLYLKICGFSLNN